jgi:hypothetical protein
MPTSFLTPDQVMRYKVEMSERNAEGDIVFQAEEIRAKYLDEMLEENMQVRSYREVTYNEFSELLDFVRQIEQLGRNEQRLLTAQGMQKLEKVQDEIVGSIERNARGKHPELTPTSVLGKALKGMKNFGATHIKAASFVHVMDGGEDGGTLWRYLIQPANEAQTKESTLRAQIAQSLSDIISPVMKAVPAKDRFGSGQYFDGIKRNLSWEQRMVIALNYGNESNLQRLRDGENWSIAQVMPVLRSLTSQDWLAIQKVWDLFESLRPQIAELEMRTTGSEPQWISPQPFVMQTADGQTLTLRGGYYPAVYDPYRSADATLMRTEDTLKRDVAGMLQTTRGAFVKERAPLVVNMPLLYTFDGMFRGFSDVAHDLAWREWVIDANKLLGNSQTRQMGRKVSNAILDNYGVDTLEQLLQWRDDMIAGDRESRSALDRFFGGFRRNVSMSRIGLNLVVAALQPFGILQSVVRIGGVWVKKGLNRFWSSPGQAWAECMEKSQFMSNRGRTRTRELNEIRNQIDTGGIRERMAQVSYFLTIKAQMLADIPTWWGMYEKAIADGHDERTAINLADQSVRDSQGGGEGVDRSKVERSQRVVEQLFTMFYAFMNTRLNLMYMSAKTAESRGKFVADMLMLTLVPAVIETAVRHVLKPGSDDDDDDSLPADMAWEMVNGTLGLVAGGREFVQIADVLRGRKMAYTGPTGLTPLGDIARLAQQTRQGELDAAFWKAFLDTTGSFTGLPSAQTKRFFTGADALIDGETEDPTVLLRGYR